MDSSEEALGPQRAQEVHLSRLTLHFFTCLHGLAACKKRLAWHALPDCLQETADERCDEQNRRVLVDT